MQVKLLTITVQTVHSLQMTKQKIKLKLSINAVLLNHSLIYTHRHSDDSDSDKISILIILKSKPSQDNFVTAIIEVEDLNNCQSSIDLERGNISFKLTGSKNQYIIRGCSSIA